MRINNDKYYTPKWLAKRLIDKTYEVVGEGNISETIEPSAGNGSFSEQAYHNHCFAYDIEPEHKNIIKANFLKLDIDYLCGRLIIGNPPFGKNMNLARKFYKKSVELGDYVAFILPISQLNNSSSLYEFDLIYSEDLGVQTYTDRKLHCCFNIYKRPSGGSLNKKMVKKLNDVTIIRQDSKKYDLTKNYDLIMCYWGNGSCGKFVDKPHTYSAEYKIIINNKDLKEEILDVILKTDWNKLKDSIASKKIQQFHIVDILTKKIKCIS